MSDLYTWLKAFHLIAVIFWVAGLLLLPRLFVYHSGAEKGGELEAQMLIAEHRLLKIIMNPAMIVAFLLGLVLIGYRADQISGSFWLPLKLILVFSLIGYHGFLSKQRGLFAQGQRPKSEKFFRMINEIPSVITICVVILAVVEPF